MKVLIVGIDSIVEPLGLMYIIAALKQGGHNVDLELIKERTNISDIQLKTGYDFVGFGVLTGNHKNLLALSRRYRNEVGCKTIAGGPHATFFAEETLEFVDFVVVGEGIKAALDIVNGKAKPGIVKTDLTEADRFPMSDREELYKDPKKRDNRIKNMLTGFGCPYSCAYCYNSLYNKMFPGFLRQRSVNSVIQEAGELLEYPLDLIFFQEDYFGINLEWLEEFAEKWPTEINKLFHCQIRPEAATEKRLKLLKKSGCHGISVGIESLNEKFRKEVLKRSGTNEKITEGCLRIKKFGMNLRTYQMLGLPGTTIEDDLETLRWNCKIRPDFARAGVYVPLKGTVLGDSCIEKGLWNGDDGGFSEMPMFDNSVLNFEPKHSRKIHLLQKIFHVAACLPYGDKIAEDFIAMENPDFKDFLDLSRKYILDGLYM